MVDPPIHNNPHSKIHIATEYHAYLRAERREILRIRLNSILLSSLSLFELVEGRRPFSSATFNLFSSTFCRLFFSLFLALFLKNLSVTELTCSSTSVEMQKRIKNRLIMPQAVYGRNKLLAR